VNTLYPKPGTPKAIKAGCTCPVKDNQRDDGNYWIDNLCPIHGERATIDFLREIMFEKNN